MTGSRFLNSGQNLSRMKLSVTPVVPIVLIPTLNISVAVAGPAAYRVCQAGCATVVMACYSAAGFT